MSQIENDNFTTYNRQQNPNIDNNNIPLIKTKKFIIIIIITISVLVIAAILISVLVIVNKNDKENKNNKGELNNNEESNNKEESNNNEELNNNEESINNYVIPQFSIENIQKTKYCLNSIIKLNCLNLNYYPDITNTDISFEFPIEGSRTKYNSDSIIGNIIEKSIPFKSNFWKCYIKG